MAFITKLDYSNNRQIKQFQLTNTKLSGTTEFGVPFSALTSGVDETSIITTSVLTGITSTFSGNTRVTEITFGADRMLVGVVELETITPTNSGTTQNTLAFEGIDPTIIDGNTVYNNYSGTTYDFTVTSMEEIGVDIWTGTTLSNDVVFLSGSSLDFQERPIWVDVKGITKTEKLIIDKLPVKDNTLQAVLGRQADGDVVEVDLTEIKSLYRGTYAELQVLIDTDSLIVGNKYILTDYRTIYQIENTNTSPIIEYYTVNGNASGWSYFNPSIPEESLGLGDTVTISALPSGYSGSLFVGQTAVVTNYWNESYMIFSPTLLVGGIEIATNKPRWPQISNNDTILDTYGNVVMQSTGVLNIDVHNDLPYMTMTGPENPSPQIEEIVLTSIENNKFSIDAESITYQGDRLEYYFSENTIYDENNVFLANRNGFIIKRSNSILNISVNKDWRVQRYRRWLMEPDKCSKYTLNQDVYKINGRNVCTTVNTSINDNHKYILLKPYSKEFYLDFASGTDYYGGLNPFISGTTYNPPTLASQRFTNDIAPEYSAHVTVSYSGLTNAKDYLIFPIESGVTDSLITKFNIDDLNNSIFLTNSSRYGLSGDININIKGSLDNSIFVTGSELYSSGGFIDAVTSIDNMNITLGGPSSYLERVHFFKTGNFNNKGKVFNLMVGGSRDNINDFCDISFDGGCEIRNSIFGAIRTDSTLFKGFYANKFLFKVLITGDNICSGSVYLTQLEGSYNIYDTDVYLKTLSSLNPKTGKNGYYYPITGNIDAKHVHNLLGNKNLIHEYADSFNVIQLITKATLQ